GWQDRRTTLKDGSYFIVGKLTDKKGCLRAVFFIYAPGGSRRFLFYRQKPRPPFGPITLYEQPAPGRKGCFYGQIQHDDGRAGHTRSRFAGQRKRRRRAAADTGH